MIHRFGGAPRRAEKSTMHVFHAPAGTTIQPQQEDADFGSERDNPGYNPASLVGRAFAMDEPALSEASASAHSGIAWWISPLRCTAAWHVAVSPAPVEM